MGQHKPKGLNQRGEIWWIEKRIEGRDIRESCRTSDLDEAIRYFEKRITEVRNEELYGVRPQITFKEAATKYLLENEHKKSIGDDAYHLKTIMPYIGSLPLERVHHQTLEPFIQQRKTEVKNKTINLTLSVVRRILNLSARLWRHDSGITYLETAPLIQMLPLSDARKAYTLDWDEQKQLIKNLPPLLANMSLYKVNTGCREQEVCQLRWDWEFQAEDPELRGRVFIVPGEFRKKTEEEMPDKIVVLNDVAKSVVDSMRGQHPKYVFTLERKRNDVLRREPMARMNESGWRTAWRKAGLPNSERYRKGPHNLRNTFATRLRALGVSEETRAQLLGHKRKSMTTEYSEAGVMELLKAVNLLCSSHNSPTLSVVQLKDYATG